MGYKETLSRMIDESKLKLKEIAEKCEALGVKINPSYISRLQTGNQAPASDEVNTAIATVCGGDVDQFRFEAFVEKSPELVKEFIIEVTNYFRETTKHILKTQVPEALWPMVLQQVENMTDYQIIKGFINMNKSIDSNNNVTIGPKMEDNSMEPRIPNGAILQIDKDSQINNGDYVLIEIKENNFLIRRIVFTNDKLFLLPENSSYDCLECYRNEVRLLGKVKGFTITNEL